MRLSTAALPAVALSAVLAAGCSGAASSSQPATPSAQSPAATAKAIPARTVHGNITIAAPGSLAPGPFNITPVYCGKLSAAQQSQFGTNADGGLVFKYTNVSNGVTGSPDLEVNFTSGGSVAGSNVPGDPSDVAPGQSATAEVDALSKSGSDVAFNGCDIMSYTVLSDSGTTPGEYAG